MVIRVDDPVPEMLDGGELRVGGEVDDSPQCNAPEVGASADVRDGVTDVPEGWWKVDLRDDDSIQMVSMRDETSVIPHSRSHTAADRIEVTPVAIVVVIATPKVVGY